jgi:hypothetical protein
LFSRAFSDSTAGRVGTNDAANATAANITDPDR